MEFVLSGRRIEETNVGPVRIRRLFLAAPFPRKCIGKSMRDSHRQQTEGMGRQPDSSLSPSLVQICNGKACGSRFSKLGAIRPSRLLQADPIMALGGRVTSGSDTALLASASASVVDGFRLSTIALGIRIVAPRSLVVS